MVLQHICFRNVQTLNVEILNLFVFKQPPKRNRRKRERKNTIHNRTFSKNTHTESEQQWRNSLAKIHRKTHTNTSKILGRLLTFHVHSRFGPTKTHVYVIVTYIKSIRSSNGHEDITKNKKKSPQFDPLKPQEQQLHAITTVSSSYSPNPVFRSPRDHLIKWKQQTVVYLNRSLYFRFFFNLIIFFCVFFDLMNIHIYHCRKNERKKDEKKKEKFTVVRRLLCSVHRKCWKTAIFASLFAVGRFIDQIYIWSLSIFFFIFFFFDCIIQSWKCYV